MPDQRVLARLKAQPDVVGLRPRADRRVGAVEHEVAVVEMGQEHDMQPQLALVHHRQAQPLGREAGADQHLLLAEGNVLAVAGLLAEIPVVRQAPILIGARGNVVRKLDDVAVDLAIDGLNKSPHRPGIQRPGRHGLELGRLGRDGLLTRGYDEIGPHDASRARHSDRGRFIRAERRRRCGWLHFGVRMAADAQRHVALAHLHEAVGRVGRLAEGNERRGDGAGEGRAVAGNGHQGGDRGGKPHGKSSHECDPEPC